MLTPTRYIASRVSNIEVLTGRTWMRRTALVLIDVQQGFDDVSWGVRNNRNAESNISRLLARWRELAEPVIHIQHCSVDPNSPLYSEKASCNFKVEAEPAPDETILTKTVNSGFIGTGLEAHLRSRGIDRLVLAGFTTDHCVSTTTRMAGNLGFATVLVSDATATFDRMGLDGVLIPAETVHRIHLASLDGEFCRVKSASEVLAEFATIPEPAA